MKEWKNKYNSFNGLKALVHVNYWKSIIENKQIPPPLLLSVDPCGVCNFSCYFCNAAEILNKIHDKMSIETIDKLCNQLIKWKSKAICIGGGGEPLLNLNTYYLIDKLKELNIQSALITNGTKIGDNLESLKKLDYLGVSVDAATEETFKLVKRSNFSFSKLITNIESITKQGLEVTYKFLLLPKNTNEVYEACKIAKSIGCDQFHLRPGSEPWFSDKKSYIFQEKQRNSVNEQLDRARIDFEDNTFKIFGVVSKFTDEWKIKATFNKCWACFTTCFVSPNGDIGLCCDRRGDDKIMLGNIDNINEKWNSPDHWKIHNNINIKDCPRCTFTHVNEIFEQVLIKDTMNCNFF